MTGRAMSVRVMHVFGAMDRGGAETRTLEILRRLDRGRYAFDFCVLSGEPGVYAPEIRRQGAAVLPCPLRSHLGLFPTRFARLVRAGRYDVVHSHVHHFSGVILALARLVGVRTRIAHIRVTDDGRASTAPRRAYRALMAWLIDRCATGVIGVSEGAMTAFWGPRWTTDRRKVVVYNGVEAERFAAPLELASVREEFGVRAAAPLVVNVARFDPQKNHRGLVRIAEALVRRRSDAVLLLVGDGPLQESIRREVDARGLAASVRFAGARDDVPRLLCAADVFVLPSLWEGLPGAVLEALAAGLPVIASPLPGVLEIARHARGIVTADPDDPGEFARIVDDVLATRTQARSTELPPVFTTAIAMERLLACYV